MQIYKSPKENVDKVAKPLFWGKTPPEEQLLFYVGKYADIEKVKELINDGIDIHDEYYENILHEASIYGNIEIIEYLISLSIDVNGLNENLETPLHEACWHTQTIASKVLIKAGANVNLLNDDGISPLYATAIQGGYHTAQLLIENDADEDIYIATMIGDIDFVKRSFNENPQSIFSINERDEDNE